jgi:hypothetical protein
MIKVALFTAREDIVLATSLRCHVFVSISARNPYDRLLNVYSKECGCVHYSPRSF